MKYFNDNKSSWTGCFSLKIKLKLQNFVYTCIKINCKNVHIGKIYLIKRTRTANVKCTCIFHYICTKHLHDRRMVIHRPSHVHFETLHSFNRNASIVADKVQEEKKGCEDSWFGCCPDNVTPAQGPEFAGCPSQCNCNKLGSFSETCSPESQQCDCRPGVGGLKCDRCEPGYWGLPKISAGHQGCIRKSRSRNTSNVGLFDAFLLFVNYCVIT